MPFWLGPRSDVCHFLSLELSALCYALIICIAGATNAVNMRQIKSVTVLQWCYFVSIVTCTLSAHFKENLRLDFLQIDKTDLKGWSHFFRHSPPRY